MTEAYRDCTGSPPWAPMVRLRAGARHRYCLCLKCGAIREDVCEDAAITEHRWHEESSDALAEPVYEEPMPLLAMPREDQLHLGEGTGGE